MKRGIFAVAMWLLVMATPALAAQKPKGAKPAGVSKSVVKAQAPKATHAKTTVKIHGKSSVKPHSGTKVKTSVKTNTKTTAPKSKATKTVKVSKTTTTTTTTTPTYTQPSTPAGTLSPVQQKLQKNPNLAAKLQSRLPAGTDVTAAAAGFHSLGQFVSTVNASHNHDLPFPALKRRIVYEGMSLGQAMKDLR
jgi:hypothetical protein